MKPSLLLLLAVSLSGQDLAIRAERLHTVSGPVIQDGVVLIRRGRIAEVGPAASVKIPSGVPVRRAKVAVPGLIDAHATAGFSGLLNQPHDQEVVEKSAPAQPELRAVDGYNPKDPLVGWLRDHGITTLHTGPGPLALITGQTLVVRTIGDTLDQAVLRPEAMVAATLGEGSRSHEGGKAPGTRSKEVALLRAELVAAQEYGRALADGKTPERSLRKETLLKVLKGELPLMITAQRSADLQSALRLAAEFKLRLVLDGAAEAHALLPELKAAGHPILLHPAMARPFGEMEQAALDTAAKLRAAAIPFAFQSGYEAYVPKTRVVLWEAAMALRGGLSADDTLRALTLDAARLLGLDSDLGSLDKGKAGDVACFDGDPFEWTTHCTGTVIGGRVVSEGERN